MTATKKLIFIIFPYLMVSVALSGLYLEVRDAGWLMGHLRWTYLVWSFRGPMSAAEYGWHGLAPIWQVLWAFLAGGLVILPFLSMPLWVRGRIAAQLCEFGLLLWIAFAALLFGTSDFEAQFDRLIAVAADLR
jgi:hypothetical protein